MNNETFKELASDVLRGTLDADLQEAWEAHRQSSPEAALFFAALAAEHDASTRRLEAVHSKRLLAATREPDSVRVPRGFFLLVVAASVFGATVAAALMFALLGPQSTERAKANIPGGVASENANALSNAEPANQQSGSQPRHSNQPPKNKPPRNAPPDEITPPETLPKEPEPPQPECKIVKLRDAAFRVKALETDSWHDASASTKLAPGDRIKVSRGALVLEGAGLQLTCSEKCDLQLPTNWAAPAFKALAGRILVVRLRAASEAAVVISQGTLKFSYASFALQVELGTSKISVADGSVSFERDGKREVVAAAGFGLLGARVVVQTLSIEKLALLEEELRGPRDVLLLWDFEAKTLPCANGKRVTPGARGSEGALNWSAQHALLGGEASDVFSPPPQTRLRFTLKSNTPKLRISFVAGQGLSAHVWFADIEPLSQSDWTLIDIALTDFKPQDKGSRYWAGQICSSLQFRMRFEPRSTILPSERRLTLDDVEIYTPK